MSKGSTPVIEAMLITIVIVSASVLFVTWSMSTRESFAETASEETERQVEKMKTSFMIAYMEDDMLGLKNKEESTIYPSELSFYLDGAKFKPISFPPPIGFAQTGEFVFPTQLKDYEVHVSGAYGRTDVFLPERSFVKIMKYAVPEEFPRMTGGNPTNTTVFIDLSGSFGRNKNRDYPVDLIFVLDVSGSMNDNCGGCNELTCAQAACNDGDGCKICDAKNASKSLAMKLDEEKDKSGLVSFSTYAYLIQPLTDRKQDVSDAIDGLETDLFTNISGAIKTANKEIQNRGRNNALKVQILLSDGNPNRPSPTSYAISQSILAAREAANQGIRIYTVGFGSDANLTLLGEIAKITRAKNYSAMTGEQLIDIYNRILAEELLQVAGREITIEDFIPSHANYQTDSLESTNSGDCHFYDNTPPSSDNITCSVSNILIDEHYIVKFNLTFLNTGCEQSTNVYPNSRIIYMDYLDSEHVKILPNLTVNVTGGGTVC